MKTIRLLVSFTASTVLLVTAVIIGSQPESTTTTQAISVLPQEKLGGQGKWRFRYRPDLLTGVPEKNLRHAHGGFAEDRSLPVADRVVYFGLPGAGLLRISHDLSKVEVVGGELDQGKNINYHNCVVFKGADGKTLLALPSDNGGKILVCDVQGKLITTLEKPKSLNGAFRPTDAAPTDDSLIVTNGYADSKMFTNMLSNWAWSEKSWGGKGDKSAWKVFSTAHGITAVPGKNELVIADREYGRLQFFTPNGDFTHGVDLPGNPHPCDVDFLDKKTMLVGNLKAKGGSAPASFLILEDEKVVSEINPGKDFEVPYSTHIHNAAFHRVVDAKGKERVFVLCLFWNPGGIAAFERVEE